MSSRKEIAERPRRLLRILQLPQIEVVIEGEVQYVLSAFKGLPIILHPSRAHVQLGVKKEVFGMYGKQLAEHGFAGQAAIDDNVKNKADIYGSATNVVWKNLTKEVDPWTIIPRYDESLDAILLEQLYLDGPPSNLVGGRYWRADLLGYIFATSAGLRLKDYYGSYEEVLFRELSLVSPLIKIMPGSLIHNKENAGIQSFYQAQVTSTRLIADYVEVVRAPYPVQDRAMVCVPELLEQVKVVKPPRTKKEEVKAVISPPTTQAQDKILSPVILSQGQFIMNQLNLPVLGTRVHPNEGTFVLSLFCGTVVMIYPNGLYVKFFVKPNVYELDIERLRTRGLDQSPWMLAQLLKPNTTASARSWWNANLTEVQRQRVTEYLANLPSDSGKPFEKCGGGKGAEWRVGVYWRADLLPYILWACTGDHIPRYRGSAVETFMNQQRMTEPLRTILEAHSELTTKEIRIRSGILRERLGHQSTAAEIVAQVATLQATRELEPEVVNEANNQEPGDSTTVAGTVRGELRRKQLEDFRAHYITRTVPSPPLPNTRMARNYPKNLIDEAWVAAEERVARGYEEQVLSRDTTIIGLREELETTQAQVRDLLAQRVVEVEQQAVLAVPYMAGIIGEDEAETYINTSAGDIFGLLTRTAGEQAHCGDFIHESLNYGFVLHEIKNWEGVVKGDQGLPKLLSDIGDCERARELPCVAAILYSLRSKIANYNDRPIVTFVADNGHTLVICVNDIKGQVARSGGHISESDIFNDIMSRVRMHCQNRLRIFHTLAVMSSSQANRRVFLDKVLNIPRVNDKILEILGTNEADIDAFIEEVMKPTVSVQEVRGRQNRRGIRRTSSVGSRRSRAGSVRGLRWHSSVVSVEPGPTVEAVSGSTMIEETSDTEEVEPTPEPEVVAPVPEPKTIVSFIPPEWQSTFDMGTQWERGRKDVVVMIMTLCTPDINGRILRQELSSRIRQRMTEITEATLRTSLTKVFHPKYRGQKTLVGLSWKA